MEKFGHLAKGAGHGFVVLLEVLPVIGVLVETFDRMFFSSMSKSAAKESIMDLIKKDSSNLQYASKEWRSSPEFIGRSFL